MASNHHTKSDWKIAAGAIGTLLGRADLHPGAAAVLDSMAGDPICVGFSGGADSLATLLVVWVHWQNHRARMVALHFNHCLRGVESDQDEEFCRGVCDSLGVTFISARWSDRPEGGVSEESARIARHDFFRSAMVEHRSPLLVLGHQLNDIAETMLMRIARGSGSGGLAAPRPVQTRNDGVIFLRPCLTVPKEKILTALKRAKVNWCQDNTNTQDGYFRNRIRNHVLPALENAAGGVDVLQAAASTRELLEEDDMALNELVAGLWPRDGNDKELPLVNFRGQPRAILRRALHRWRLGVGLELSKATFNELLTNLGNGKDARTSVGKGVYVCLRRDRLALENDQPDERPQPGGQSLIVGGPDLIWEKAKVGAAPLQLSHALRTDILTGNVSNRSDAYLFVPGRVRVVGLRSWERGDRYRPLGAPGTIKLQDLFTDKKVPRALRATLPVFTSSSGEILWVPGFPPAEHFKVTPSARIVLHLTYRAEPPL